jgi:hypothetical protein
MVVDMWWGLGEAIEYLEHVRWRVAVKADAREQKGVKHRDVEEKGRWWLKREK